MTSQRLEREEACGSSAGFRTLNCLDGNLFRRNSCSVFGKTGQSSKESTEDEGWPDTQPHGA